MTWMFCEVYWDLELEPVKTSGGQLVAFGGVRYLASMGAKAGNTSGGQPVVFGLYGNPKPRR